MQEIPRIFHQIWLGGKPLPSSFVNFQQTWRDRHPDWEMKMWNETNIHKIPNINMDDLALCKNYAEKSDYLRFFIIKAYGGVYIDTDFECLKCIDSLLINLECFFVFEPTGKNNKNIIANAIFGSAKDNKYISTVCNALKKRISSTEINYLTTSPYKIGPYWLNDLVLNNDQFKGVTIFCTKYFYPLDPKYFYVGRNVNNSVKKSVGSYAIHHYASSHVSMIGRMHKYIWNIPFIGIYVYNFLKRIKTIFTSD